MKVIFDKNLNLDLNEKLPKISNYSKFKRNTKLKYKYPSLYKSGFSLPVNKTSLISYKYPILEDKNYLDKKNLKLNLTLKDLILDKNLINVPKYKHPLPTFKISHKFNNISEIKREKEMTILKENKFYFLNHKNETNEEFFKIIRNNINEPMNLYVRNFNLTKNNNDDMLNDNLNEKIFLTNETKKNENLNKNENMLKQKNTNKNVSFLGSQTKFIEREKLIRKKDLSHISNLSYFYDENIIKNMKEFNQNLKNLLK